MSDVQRHIGSQRPVGDLKFDRSHDPSKPPVALAFK